MSAMYQMSKSSTSKVVYFLVTTSQAILVVFAMHKNYIEFWGSLLACANFNYINTKIQFPIRRIFLCFMASLILALSFLLKDVSTNL